MQVQVDINLGISATAEYNYKDTDNNGVVDDIIEQINVQHGAAKDVFYNSPTGMRGFQLSASSQEPVSTLDGVYKLFSNSGYPGLISRSLSAADGSFAEPIKIEFTVAGDVSEIVIIFDPLSKEYAKDFTIVCEDTLNMRMEAVDCKNYHGYKYSLSADRIRAWSTEMRFALYIYKWSKAYSSAKITHLGPIFSLRYTGKDLISFACAENAYDAQMSLQPGISEQYAEVRLYDRDAELLDRIKTLKISDNVMLSITAIDHSSDEGSSYMLGTYIMDNIDNINNDFEVSLVCKDLSYTLDDIYVQAWPVQDRTLDDMLNIAFSYLPGCSWRYGNTTTKDDCKNIVTPDSHLSSCTLRECFTKICNVGMLRIYWYVDSFVVTEVHNGFSRG